MKVVRAIAITALALLALTATWGGALLLLDPTGALIHLPLSLLDRTPFDSFLLPGLILLFTNGLPSTVILVMVFFLKDRCGLFAAIQGGVLALWVGAQVLLMHLLIWPYYFCWGVALALVVTGLLLMRFVPPKAPKLELVSNPASNQADNRTRQTGNGASQRISNRATYQD